MVKTTDYQQRFAEAMALSGKTEHELAAHLGVSYQAIRKVILGTTKMLKADHNALAAKLMAIDSEWLATGIGQPRGPRVWPFSQELLEAATRADRRLQREAENAARQWFGLDALPRLENRRSA